MEKPHKKRESGLCLKAFLITLFVFDVTHECEVIVYDVIIQSRRRQTDLLAAWEDIYVMDVSYIRGGNPEDKMQHDI